MNVSAKNSLTNTNTNNINKTVESNTSNSI